MHPEELAASVGRLFERSPAFPGESLAVDLIANPRAGGFVRPKHSKRHKADLAALEKMAAVLPERAAPASLRLHLTERSAHAADIARGIVESARLEKDERRHIIITAGGDGTSLETATALVELPVAERGRFSILRLPMGTGNDGSEGRDLKVCLSRVLGPMVNEPRRAIRILPNPAGGKEPLWSFNIVSIGVDAFVCRMTNRLKRIFPGDSFKFWVDVSSVFYDKIWPPEKLKLKAYDAAGREVVSFEEVFLLCAMGVSGRRQYGSNKSILPDDDNVCEVAQMSLFKKLAFKDLIASGRHRGLDLVRLFSATRLRMDYPRSILLQSEGEVTELQASDFPLEFQLTDPLYNVLSPR
jgi:diacylglycerol kinase family enzyme